MNIAALWDQLIDAVCRPPRDIYNGDHDLVGGSRANFSFGETRRHIKKYYRQDVELHNSRGQLIMCSHYRPCIVPSKDGRLPCVIYCHTNSGSRRDVVEILFHLLPKNITVFSFDFSGSGLSEGEWVTLGAHEIDDVDAVVRYLREETSTSSVALWGRSMGAVTALLYSERDPSIAGVVADSPFSSLVDLMMELGSDPGNGFNIPRPLLKLALGLVRRAVRRRAGFNIDDVCPLSTVKQSFVPVLFGHAKDDTFIMSHHSERLFGAHGAESKNLIYFEGDHNSLRPDFWYDSGMMFLVNVLRVEDSVNMLDDEMMHVMMSGGSSSVDDMSHGGSGRGFFSKGWKSMCSMEHDERAVTCDSRRTSNDVDDAGSKHQKQQHSHHSALDTETEEVIIRDEIRCHQYRAPWDIQNQRRSIDTDQVYIQGEEEDMSMYSMEADEEAILQRVIEMSLADRESMVSLDSAEKQNDVREDDEDLAKAIEESLREVHEMHDVDEHSPPN